MGLLPHLVHAAGFAPSETIFPATTRAWLSVPDPEGLKEHFDRSPYGRLIADPSMQDFVEEFRKQVAEGGKQRLVKLGLTLDDLAKVPGGELAVAAIEAEPGRLCTVLLVDTTGHEEDAKALIETITGRLVEQKATKVAMNGAPPQLTVYQLPPDPNDARGESAPRDRRVAFAQAASALVVGDDPLQVGQAFAVLSQGRADSLATLPGFAAVTTRVSKELKGSAAPIKWYIDPFGFAKAFQATNPPREKRKGPDYVAILARQGFDAVKAAGGAVVFDDGRHSMRHHTLVYAPPLAGRDPNGPDRYDLAGRMLRFPGADGVAPPAWAPAGVAGWSALHWDMQNAFASAESLVDEVVGEKGVFDDVIASLKEDPDGPQIDVEKDLVGCLGTRITLLTDHVDPIDTDSERIVIAIEATDPERVAATVGKTMQTDSDMQKIDIKGHVVWELIDRSAAIPKIEVETPGLPGVTAESPPKRHANDDDAAHRRRQRLKEKEEKLLPHSAVTVAHGHLLIASHRDILEKVLTPAGGSDTLAATADYAATAAVLGTLLPGKAAIRSFTREAETVRPAYEMLRQGSMPKSKSVFGQLLNGILGDGKPGTVREQRIDGSSLPEFEKVRRYFGTACLGMESTADGWYLTGASVQHDQAEPEVARRNAADAATRSPR